jgi:hypothetical protein
MPVTRHMIRQPLVTVPFVAPPPFSPPSVAGLFAWFDASNAGSITASGGAVSQWNDLSGNARHVTQGTGANQPTTGTRTMNLLNVIDFDGTTDSLGNAAGMSQPFTLVMAFQADANGGNIALHNQAQFLRKSGQWKLYAGGSEIGGGTSDAAAHVGSAVFNAASSQLWIDGGSIVTGDPGNGTTSGLTFGTDAGFAFFDGGLAEVTIYSTVLGTTDRQALEGYLKAKWGTP